MQRNESSFSAPPPAAAAGLADCTKPICFRLAILACFLSISVPGAGHTQSSVPRWGISKQLRVTGNGTERESVFPAVDAMIAPSGDFYATQNDHIKHYSPTGRLLRVIGRGGDGPGEFRQVSRLGMFGDKLWAFDVRHQRISFFNSNGGFISSTPNPVATTRMELASVLASGRLVTYEMEQKTSSSSLKTSYVVRLHDARGAVQRELARLLDGTPAVRRVELDGGGFTLVRPPYSDRPLVSVSADGQHSVVVEVRTPASPTASLVVRRFDGNGDSVLAIRRSLPADRPNSALVDFLVQEQVQFLASRRLTHPQLEKRLREAMWPASTWVPSFIRAFAEEDGHLWLQSSDHVSWVRLDRELRMLGKIEMPRTITVLKIRGFQLWGLEFNDDGEPSFVKYDVTRPAAR